jgi:glycogen(starch) synthase
MKILFWSDSYPPRLGGIEKMSHLLAHGLARRGHLVQVMASQDMDEGLPEHSKEGEVKVCRLPLLDSLEQENVVLLAANLRKIAAIKQKFQPEIVHLFALRATCFFHLSTMAPALPAATVVTMHDATGGLRGGQGTLLGSLFEQAKEVTFVSGALRQEVLEVLPELSLRSKTIHNALSFENIPAPVSRKDMSKPVFFAAGRMSPEKGFDVLLDAFRVVLERMPEAKLVLAGTGPGEQELRAQAERLGLVKYVEFLGWLPDQPLRIQMSEADIVIVPSRTETFGLVALEAAQLGKPVVASNTGGLPEIVDDGVTGLLVPPGEARTLTAAMLCLAQSPEQCRTMGLAAHARALECFNPEDMLDAYEQVYVRAVQSGADHARSGRQRLER